jgi:hypothetical protein
MVSLLKFLSQTFKAAVAMSGNSSILTMSTECDKNFSK